MPTRGRSLPSTNGESGFTPSGYIRLLIDLLSPHDCKASRRLAAQDALLGQVSHRHRYKELLIVCLMAYLWVHVEWSWWITLLHGMNMAKTTLLQSQNRPNSSYRSVHVNVVGFLKKDDKSIRVHLKGQFNPKNKYNSVIIYSLLCLLKSVGLFFFCGTWKEIYSRLSKLPFSIHTMGTGASR